MNYVAVKLIDWGASHQILAISVVFEPFGHVSLYGRHQNDKLMGSSPVAKPWKWFAKSASGEYQAYVSPAAAQILDELVLGDPVLSRIANLYGYESSDE